MSESNLTTTLPQINLVGHSFGLWTVLSFAGRTKNGDAQWTCCCQCGLVAVRCGGNLRTGKTKSCKKCSRGKRTHGLSCTPEYKAWARMLRRCYDPNDPQYKNYGNRGIAVCLRWRNSVETFVKDVGLKPGNEYSIGRIDNDGDYEPQNVQWETTLQQVRNRRITKVLTINGLTRPFAEWTAIYNIPYRIAWQRIANYGWDPIQAVTTPVKSRKGISK